MMEISKREWLLLYWAEGENLLKIIQKKVGMSSTDPILLKIFVYGLVKFYNVPLNKLRGRLTLWEGVNEEEAKEWWIKQLGISIRFIKTYWRKRGKKSGKHPYGTLRIYVNSKEILLKILEDLQKLKKDFENIKV